MNRIIHLVQNLSLDITAGALITSAFLARLMEVEISASMMLGLAIAIWLIYTFDHLRDAYKSKDQASNPRHAFHQRHFKALVIAGSVAFIAGLYNLQFLPWATIEIGLVLVSLSALYFVYLVLAKRAVNKELFAATVYVAGVATAPLSQVEQVSAAVLLVLMICWILAYCNLLIIPLFEVKLDISDEQESVVTRLGLRKVRMLLVALLILSMLLIQLFGLEGGYASAYFILTSMSFTLVVLLARPALFRKYQLYRILSDGIFFLPALIWLL